MASSEGAAARGARTKFLLNVLFSVVGLATFALLVHAVGARALLTAIGRTQAALPLLLAIEACRLGLEIAATYSLSERIRSNVRLASLVRTLLIGYGLASVLPAGRVAAETVKAGLLAPRIGGHAAALAATNQALSLLSNAAIALPCALAAWSIDQPGVAVAFAAFALANLGFFGLIPARRAAARRPRSLRKAARALPRPGGEVSG